MRLYPLLVVVGLLAGSTASGGDAGSTPEPLADGLYAVWETPRGAFTAELFYELAPLTVANFVGLTEGTLPNSFRAPGQPFYDGLTFHRVVPEFVVQGGDPLGTGEGTPGYEFADEFTPLLKHDAAGILAMANAGPATNGSQFFLTLAPVNRLNYKHSVFGRVVQGLEVLPRIQQGDVMKTVRIVRVGERARSFRADAPAFAALQANEPPIPPRDPGLPPLYANESSVEVVDGYAGWLNEKLHQYAVTTGITVRVRLVAAFAAPPADVKAFNPLLDLHRRLAGDDPRAATIVFVADEHRWRLWLGDGLLPRFDLAPDAVAEGPGAKKLHDLKQAVLAPAKKYWDQAGEPRHRAIDSAVTELIEALDRPQSLKL